MTRPHSARLWIALGLACLLGACSPSAPDEPAALAADNVAQATPAAPEVTRADTTQPETSVTTPAGPESGAASEPPPNIQAWMDRLTVDHAYDPETGFIVAREVIGLPPVIAGGPSIDDALGQTAESDHLLVVFATADRCAPCQQYKKSALNDPRVVEALSGPRFVVTHIEVDQEPEVAQAALGSLAIPMTYLFKDGERVAELRGQRSADELLAWLENATAS